MFRADNSLNERHRVYGVLTLFMQNNERNRDFPTDVRGDFLARRGRGLALDDVYVVSPSLVINTRYGFNRFGAADGPLTLGTDLTSLGMPPSLVNQLDPSLTALPYITIDGYAGLGFSGGSGSDAKTQNHFISSLATQGSLRLNADASGARGGASAIAEIIVYAGALEKGQIRSIERYLLSKYGISAQAR